jgi:alpha-tubulin suppressor-like RCC1 family protein
VQQVQATGSAFAAVLADGSVVAWGNPDCGGDSSAVQDQLKHVQQVQATGSAFAAILADGSVVAWGNPHEGGDCSAVQDQLLCV